MFLQTVSEAERARIPPKAGERGRERAPKSSQGILSACLQKYYLNLRKILPLDKSPRVK